MNHTKNQKLVIPAPDHPSQGPAAGIQLIDSPRVTRRLCPLSGIVIPLDSRFRGNDE
jgi:hypothetical protein